MASLTSWKISMQKIRQFIKYWRFFFSIISNYFNCKTFLVFFSKVFFNAKCHCQTKGGVQQYPNSFPCHRSASFNRSLSLNLVCYCCWYTLLVAWLWSEYPFFSFDCNVSLLLLSSSSLGAPLLFDQHCSAAQKMSSSLYKLYVFHDSRDGFNLRLIFKTIVIQVTCTVCMCVDTLNHNILTNSSSLLVCFLFKCHSYYSGALSFFVFFFFSSIRK